MSDVCLEPDCHRLTAGRTRCPIHARAKERQRSGREKYDHAWAKHSRQRRSESPYCAMADPTCKGVLSVDHPTDAVLCMSHHDRLEARRRAARA